MLVDTKLEMVLELVFDYAKIRKSTPTGVFGHEIPVDGASYKSTPPNKFLHISGRTGSRCRNFYINLVGLAIIDMLARQN